MDRKPVETVEIGQSMARRLAAYCRERGIPGLRIVADANTWAALGRAAAEACRSAGIDVATTVYEESPEADEGALARLAAAAEEEGREGKSRLPVAVGSGSITDLVRHHAATRGSPFISFPSAASVDAYSSAVAALLVEGVKLTLPASPPLAIFVDLDVLRAAPRPMTAAGFGDIICKFSALADWRLGALLWDEPWDADVAARMRAAAEACTAAAPAIGRGEAEGLATLMRGLLASGAAMAETGHSRPASGAEHHLSHFWEMRLRAEGRPPILHGLKVGVATLIIAGHWKALAGLGRAELERRLAVAELPDSAAARARIEAVFGMGAPAILKAQERFLGMDATAFEGLKGKILDNWEEILGLAASVPGPAEAARLLEAAGCPTRPEALGLMARDVADAFEDAHWLRARFTVLKLLGFLGPGGGSYRD